ncbi:hypothetical protein MNV49_007216 [Pseudohyphozyma bogoriensis]|nr:hypothetical protein MNV49_007216 [Pseudohyphozyma bogoriensis]
MGLVCAHGPAPKLWGLDIKLHPTFLGGVMIASSNQPPANIANKGLWMNAEDMPLTTKYYGIQYQYPNVFPAPTLNVIRLLRIIQDKEEGIWGKNGDAAGVTKPASWHKIIPTSLISEDKLREYMVLAQSESNKARVKSEPQELVENGAFGFPWIIVEREDGEKHRFFGSDRLELMAYFLGKEYLGPFPEGPKPRL